MSVTEANRLKEKLRLFESSKLFAWVKWIGGGVVEVTESSFHFFKKNQRIHLEDWVGQKDLNKIQDHYESIRTDPSRIKFSLSSSGTRMICKSIEVDGEINSLWTKDEDAYTMSFFQTAAHDLRSPINSIIGIVTLGKQMVENGEMNASEASKILSMIENSSYQAVDLTNDVLELAIIESDHFVLETQPVVMKDFLMNYINTHRLLTLKKKISMELHAETNGKVAINQSKITRVIDNLVTNAVKFSPAGSKININLSDNSKFITVEITDEGVGMSDAMVRNIFEKFGRSRRKGLEGETSYGLGMSIVKQIMDLHKGKIAIISSEGSGTQVKLLFKKFKE